MTRGSDDGNKRWDDGLPARGDALLFVRGEQPEFVGRAERVTSEIAIKLGWLVRELVRESNEPDRMRDWATKFVLQCVFAMFAEDTGLLPAGLFTETMKQADAARSMAETFALFDDFGNRAPRERRNLSAPHVNGALFDRLRPRVQLTPSQIHELHCAARDFDWEGVRPEIFGSIFVQALHPIERHELGAHFTREADIARVVGPTVIAPWQDRIDEIRTPKDAERVIEQMKGYHVLDPACGCGNFLYVVYREMKRLEVALARKWTEVHRDHCADVRPPPPGPWFTLEQLHGIEADACAAVLARVVLWIGEHLANRELNLDEDTLPLKNLIMVVYRADALLNLPWPRPTGELAIVGNPPRLGVRELRAELGDEEVDELLARYPKNRNADYVTYWFTNALTTLRPGERAGFVASHAIVQNVSREASIEQILAAGGSLTNAWKAYPWPGEAAADTVIVNWIMSPWDGIRTLGEKEVVAISPDLTEAMNPSREAPGSPATNTPELFPIFS